MRDDLRDALAPIVWAEAQIPILQERFGAWQRKDPYEIISEPDPSDGDWKLIVAYERKPLDPVIHGDIGAIINSIRTALDLMMFAVITKNRKIANENQHFPISRSAGDFAKRIAAFEGKNWITAAEAAAIKQAKPYRGGHHFLHAMHCLDIKRKHENILSVSTEISKGQITAMGVGIEPGLRYLDNKTVLFRIHRSIRFPPSKGNTFLSLEIVINEPSCGVDKKPAILLITNCINSVRGLIRAFP
jgi:hypothetical protein